MNERLRQFAKTMRSAPTDAEAALWYHLRAGRLLGHKFKRQQPIGDYIVDFVCFAQKLIVELDGGQHVEQAKADAQRTKWLESQGLRMLRFWNDQAFEERDTVLDAIIGALRAPHPLPNPSPIRGRGYKTAYLMLVHEYECHTANGNAACASFPGLTPGNL